MLGLRHDGFERKSSGDDFLTSMKAISSPFARDELPGTVCGIRSSINGAVGHDEDA